MALLPPSCAVNIAKVPHLSPFHRGSRSASSSPPTGQGAQPPCPCPGWRTHARWSLRHVRLCATALAGSAIRARCTATAPEEYLVPTARRRRHKRAGGNIPIRGQGSGFRNLSSGRRRAAVLDDWRRCGCRAHRNTTASALHERQSAVRCDRTSSL
jgi:hypothetical protein